MLLTFFGVCQHCTLTLLYIISYCLIQCLQFSGLQRGYKFSNWSVWLVAGNVSNWTDHCTSKYLTKHFYGLYALTDNHTSFHCYSLCVQSYWVEKVNILAKCFENSQAQTMTICDLWVTVYLWMFCIHLSSIILTVTHPPFPSTVYRGIAWLPLQLVGVYYINNNNYSYFSRQ